MDDLQNKNVLFETLRVRNGQAEYAEEHLARLQQSIAVLGFKVSANISAEEIQRFAREYSHPEKIYSLRIFATQNGAQLACEEYSPLPAQKYCAGVVLQRAQHPNLSRAAHKFWQRPAYNELLQAAQAQACDDALLCDGDELLETTTSNFFMVLDNKMIVPPRGKRLLGVMEKIFLQKSGMLVRAEKILWPLPTAAQCYISSSLKGVVPVAKIDERFLLVFPFGAG